MPKLIRTFLSMEHALAYCFQRQKAKPDLYVERGLDGKYHVYDPDA